MIEFIMVVIYISENPIYIFQAQIEDGKFP